MSLVLLSGYANANAQQTSASQSQRPQSLSPSLFTPADTGRMTWGRHTFSAAYPPYVVPAACERAMAGTEWLVTDRADDTLALHPYSVVADTLATATRSVSRACAQALLGAAAARDTSGGSLSRFWSAFRFAVAMHDTVSANRALDGLTTAAVLPHVRAERFVAALETYLAARPPQPAGAANIIQRLDAMSRTTVRSRSDPAVASTNVWRARIDARLRLLQYAQRSFDTDTLRRVAEELITFLSEAPAGVVEPADLWLPYQLLIDLANDAGDLAQQQRLVQEGSIQWKNRKSAGASSVFSALRSTVAIRSAVYGQPMRSVPGTHWFPVGTAPRPMLGKISLLVRVDPLCRAACYPRIGTVRELAAQFGAALDVTLLAETAGYVPDTGPIPVDAEASSIARYYRETLRVPATVLVSERRVTRDESGRVQYQRSDVAAMLNGWSGGNALLLDQDGLVRWIGQIDTRTDARRLAAIISRIVLPTCTVPCTLHLED